MIDFTAPGKGAENPAIPAVGSRCRLQIGLIQLVTVAKGVGAHDPAQGRGAVDRPHAFGQPRTAAGRQPVDIVVGVFGIGRRHRGPVKLDGVGGVKPVVSIGVIHIDRDFFSEVIHSHRAQIKAGRIDAVVGEHRLIDAVDALRRKRHFVSLVTRSLADRRCPGRHDQAI